MRKMDNSSEFYKNKLNQIRNVNWDSLTNEQLHDVWRATNDNRALEYLTVRNIPFVVSIIDSYASNALLPKEDLVDYGTMGLIEAIHKFVSSRGNKLTTAAYWSVKKRVIEAFRKRANMVYLPSNIHDDVNKIKRFEETDQYEKVAPGLDEVALEDFVCTSLKMKVTDYRNAKSAMLHKKEQAEFVTSKMEHAIVSDDNVQTPDDVLMDKLDAEERSQLIREIISKLSAKEQEIMKLRYFGEKKTAEHVASVLGIKVGEVNRLDKKLKDALKSKITGFRFEAVKRKKTNARNNGKSNKSERE